MSIPTPAEALDRLIDLGLADDWGKMNSVPHASVNPLAGLLDHKTASDLANAAQPELARAWLDESGEMPWDPRSLEAARIGLLAPSPDPLLLDKSAKAGARFLFSKEHDARQALDTILKPTLATLRSMGSKPGHGLLLIAADCAERLGKGRFWKQC